MTLLNTNECASMLGISRRTLYRWIADNRIPYKTVGSTYRFIKEEIIEWME